jgi:hypothetical protein
MQYDAELAQAIRPLAEMLEDLNEHTGVQLVISRVFGSAALSRSFLDIMEDKERRGELTLAMQNERRLSGRMLATAIREDHPLAFSILNHLLFEPTGG